MEDYLRNLAWRFVNTVEEANAKEADGDSSLIDLLLDEAHFVNGTTAGGFSVTFFGGADPAIRLEMTGNPRVNVVISHRGEKLESGFFSWSFSWLFHRIAETFKD